MEALSYPRSYRSPWDLLTSIHPQFAGDRFTLPSTLRLLLGKTTYDIWKILTHHRSPSAITHISFSTVRFKLFMESPEVGKHLKRSSLKYHFAKLKSVGLLEDLPCPIMQLHKRRVFGSFARLKDTQDNPTIFVVVIPEQTYQFLKKANRHGGDRKSEAFLQRKAKQNKPADSYPRVIRIWDRKPASSLVGIKFSPLDNPNSLREGKPKLSLSERSQKRKEDLNDFSSLTEEGQTNSSGSSAQSPRCARSLLVSGASLRSAPVSSLQGASPPAPRLKKELQLDPLESLGERNFGGAKEAPLATSKTNGIGLFSEAQESGGAEARSEGEEALQRDQEAKEGHALPHPGEDSHDPREIGAARNILDDVHGYYFNASGHASQLWNVPPYPTTRDLPHARVPAPPLLPAQLDDRVKVEWLCRYYKYAIRWAFRDKTLTKLDLKKWDREYKLLLASAEKLIAYRIPPAKWAMFKLDLWKEELGLRKGKHPPLTWLWSTDWLDDPQKRAWFWNETGDRYTIGLIVVPEAIEELQKRHEKMRRSLRMSRVRVWEKDKIREIKEKFFPGTLYEDLIQRGELEAQSTQASLTTRATEGGWPW